MLYKKDYRVIPLPCPFACLNFGDTSFLGGKISKEKLSQIKEVSAVVQSDVVKIVRSYEVQSFDLEIPGAMDMRIFHSDSKYLTEPMHKIINSISATKTFFITNAIVKGADGKYHKVAPMKVVVP
ncbi:MAG: hypothetical protein MJZ24_03140 [Paludibacteraceae bacterium]|nr:hypothetical protein [Paludibacteraceae bacterium]